MQVCGDGCEGSLPGFKPDGVLKGEVDGTTVLAMPSCPEKVRRCCEHVRSEVTTSTPTLTSRPVQHESPKETGSLNSSLTFGRSFEDGPPVVPGAAVSRKGKWVWKPFDVGITKC